MLKMFYSSFECSCETDDSVRFVVNIFALLSVAPKLVWRRNNDPNTRRLFDSSEARDANEPVL